MSTSGVLRHFTLGPTLRRMQRRLGLYGPDDYRADLASLLCKVITPERFITQLLGIQHVPDTAETLPATCSSYVSSRLCEVDALIRRLEIGPDDRFWDIGCGLGAVPMLVSFLTHAHASGIEFHREYCDLGRRAARGFRLDDVTFFHGDARDVDCSSGTCFFMFIPFTGIILDRVMERVREADRLRPIRVAWMGPRGEMARYAWLEEVPHDTYDGLSLKIYRSTARPEVSTI